MHSGRIDRYVLDVAGNPIPEPDLLTWARWFETADRHLAVDEVGIYRVSTIFLGLDHGFPGMGGPPVLWETILFGGEVELGEVVLPTGTIIPSRKVHETLEQQRYRSREAALAGHAELVAQAHRLHQHLVRNGALESEARQGADGDPGDEQRDPPQGR